MHTQSVSVVLPCFNEERVIAHTVEQVLSWMRRNRLRGEVIVVDDGSLDDSAAVLRKLHAEHPEIVVLRHSKNRGVGAALRTGCDRARMDIIALMDSDGQFDPLDFDLLLPLLSSMDVASGIRIERADPAIRKLNAFLWNTLVRILLSIPARDVDCSMKVFRREVWPKIRPAHANGGLFGAEFWHLVASKKLRWAQRPVRHFERRHGDATGAKLRVIVRAFRELGSLLKTVWQDKKSKRRGHLGHPIPTGL